MARNHVLHAAALFALAAGFFAAGCAKPPASPAGSELLDFRDVVQSAKDKVFPAVVYIKCLSESHEQGRKVTGEVVGSGVIISPRGEILTNWHVVDKAVEIRCLMLDGTSAAAEVVGTDKDTDLALIRLKLPADHADVPYAVFGDSDVLKEGDFVMAMGAPWGLNRSVSIGIVSCTRRYLPAKSEYSLWIQTDASISPGNSGGPLVNTSGEIVGINALGATAGGDMGFAVPSQTAQIIVEHLRRHGRAEWSWTGIRLQPLRDFNRNIYFDGEDGVIVAETDPESPARLAGLQMRDRILQINGQPVAGLSEEDLPTIRRALGLLETEQPATLTVRRGGETLPLTLTPRHKGKVEGDELDCPRWDLTVKTINQFDNPDLFFHRRVGVFIFGVKYPGNAAVSGLERNDILLRVGDRNIETLDDVRQAHAEAIQGLPGRHRVVLTILRNGLMRQVPLDFSRDYLRD